MTRLHWSSIAPSFHRLAAIACVLLLVAPSAAQVRTRKLTLPKPMALTLNTTDGVQLRVHFYPGGVVERFNEGEKEPEYVPKLGKEVVPIIVLHGWGGRKNEFSYLAAYLQRRGHAVAIPDLRGHGESTKRRFPNGAEVTIDPDRMRPADIQTMIQDIETVKKFLLKKNNEAELNIEQLTIVGAELGAILAVNWAVLDWNRAQLPSFKQGQDVKAAVLLSPPQSYKGISLRAAFQHPFVGARMSTMIVVGQEDRKSYSDAKSIHKRLERMHPEPSNPEDEDLFIVALPTSLSGARLVDPRVSLQVEALIETFVERRLVDQKAYFSWQERKNPLDPDG